MSVVPLRVAGAYHGRFLNWVPADQDKYGVLEQKQAVIEHPRSWLKFYSNAKINGEINILYNSELGREVGLPLDERYAFEVPRGSLKKHKLRMYDPRCDTCFVDKSSWALKKQTKYAFILKAAYHERVKQKLPLNHYYTYASNVLGFRFGIKLNEGKLLDSFKDEIDKDYVKPIIEAVRDLREFMPEKEVIKKVMGFESTTPLKKYVHALKEEHWDKNKAARRKSREVNFSYIYRPLLYGLCFVSIALPEILPYVYLIATSTTFTVFNLTSPLVSNKRGRKVKKTY